MKAWQLGSFCSIALYGTFVFCITRGIICYILFICIYNEGHTIRLICFCGMLGLSFGSRFLSDSILVDIIDYDEFITLVRNESIYLMMKPFLLKFMSIFAFLIPLSIFYAIGKLPTIKYNIANYYYIWNREYIYIAFLFIYYEQVMYHQSIQKYNCKITMWRCIVNSL